MVEGARRGEGEGSRRSVPQPGPFGGWALTDTQVPSNYQKSGKRHCRDGSVVAESLFLNADDLPLSDSSFQGLILGMP